MMPRVTEFAGLRMAGVAARTSNAAESDPATGKIGGVWREAMSGPQPEVLIAAYTEYESDVMGPYTFVLGREVRREDEVSAGWMEVKIPAGRYLVFTAKGPMPGALIEAWMAIWRYFENDTRQRRAYAVDFERHEAGKTDEVEIYVGVE
jgi:predicted transcriptional regulator YdeE